MGETDERSFTKAELAKARGENPQARVEAAARRVSSFLPVAASAALALAFAFAGVGFGEALGAVLVLNTPRIFSTIRAFAPKKS